MVDQGLRLWQKETIQEQWAYCRYSGTQRSVLKNLKCLAQETVVLLGPIFRTTWLIKFLLHKIMAAPKLGQPDYAERIHFCTWLLQNAHDGIKDPQLLFTSDGTWFHLWIHVKNTWIWSKENPPAIQHVFLHTVKVGVWRFVCSWCITVPILFFK